MSKLLLLAIGALLGYCAGEYIDHYEETLSISHEVRELQSTQSLYAQVEEARKGPLGACATYNQMASAKGLRKKICG